MRLKLHFLARFRRLRQPGKAFTLIELLVVVGIIVMVAASSLLVLDQVDDQARFDKTRQGYKEIHTAIFGPGLTTTLNGSVVVSGYLADTGMMPEILEDLMVRPTRPNYEIPEWGNVASVAKGGRIQAGWRGPYLNPAETSLKDNWGTDWRFSVSDLALPLSNRYRAGFLWPNEPPDVALGSWGKNGVPEGATPSIDTYDNEFPPDGASVIPGTSFALKQVVIPTRTIVKTFMPATPTVTNPTDWDVYVGVIYPGLFMGGVNTFSENHPCLLRDSSNNVVKLTVKGNTSKDGTVTAIYDDKNKYKGTTIKLNLSNLPSGLTFNLGYARQLQIALFNQRNTSGTMAPAGGNLAQRLLAVDPIIFTYMPRANNSGSQIISENVEVNRWMINP